MLYKCLVPCHIVKDMPKIPPLLNHLVESSAELFRQDFVPFLESVGSNPCFDRLELERVCYWAFESNHERFGRYKYRWMVIEWMWTASFELKQMIKGYCTARRYLWIPQVWSKWKIRKISEKNQERLFLSSLTVFYTNKHENHWRNRHLSSHCRWSLDGVGGSFVRTYAKE